MKLTRPAGLMFSGLMLASSGVYAQKADSQDASNPAASAAQVKSEAEARKKADSDAREKILLDADALIKSGKPDEAYSLLEPFEFERSGEVRFDYLLGVAALDSGKPDKATLAFERVLLVDPDFAGARMDMARAYYQLGDLQRARPNSKRSCSKILPQRRAPRSGNIWMRSPGRNRGSRRASAAMSRERSAMTATSITPPTLSQISIPVFCGNVSPR